MASSSPPSSPVSDSSSVYFDCIEDSSVGEHGHIRPLIKWNSELLVTSEHETPPLTPCTERSASAVTTSLLVIIFHGDIFPQVSEIFQKFHIFCEFA